MSQGANGKPLSIQLYTLREAAAADFAGVLERVAKIGFKGVEIAGLYGLTPAEYRRRVEDLGMVVSSSHTPWANQVSPQEVVDTAGALGVKWMVCGFGAESFASRSEIEKTAGIVNRVLEGLEGSGVKLAIHNHYWEFERLEGRLKHDLLRELCPDLKFELDLYWAANFGAEDPAAMVRDFAARMPLLHVKDGPLVRDQANTAVGAGAVDIPATLEAIDPTVLEWLIVELDRCDTDMWTAVEDSYRYLVGRNLAEGNV